MSGRNGLLFEPGAPEAAPDVPCRKCGTRPAPGAERDEWGWVGTCCLNLDFFSAPSPEQPELVDGEESRSAP